MFSFVASITTYLTYPAIEARVMRREEGHAAGELYQTLPQQEQPEVQLRSAGLDELRFEDDETEKTRRTDDFHKKSCAEKGGNGDVRHEMYRRGRRDDLPAAAGTL